MNLTCHTPSPERFCIRDELQLRTNALLFRSFKWMHYKIYFSPKCCMHFFSQPSELYAQPIRIYLISVLQQNYVKSINDEVPHARV